MGVAIILRSCFCASDAMASSDQVFTIDSVIRGHQVYKHVWTPVEGEELVLEQEHHHRYTTTVLKDGVIVGRVPRELSRVLLEFLSKWRADNL